MASIQTLTDEERRVAARWATDCAERVLPLFQADAASEQVVKDALARTRAYSAGESTAAAEISRRLGAGRVAKAASTPAGAAAARAVGQASAVAHMAAHALGAAGYAVKAVSLAHPEEPDAVQDEIDWQLSRLTARERSVLRQLPPLGENSSGPLGPGLLSQGIVGATIRELQARMA
ncbi:putative immunity protein [Microbacterium sp. SD291]|uniref:putative immunity protein n=1 Tax=Microbacterium sp. SD291 TaxID=2782007 RepID=UPI001A958D30|nr:hypothetical protein [Microbacterium sp. SD291]MBO0979288.1 hypothetical protein [Microbacterium sp. SD291]